MVPQSIIMCAVQNSGYKRGDLPETEKAAGEIFSLPMYPTLNNREIDMVCRCVRAVC